MRKSEKVLDIRADGRWFVCIFHHWEKVNPYYLYEMWYESKSDRGNRLRRKQIARYQNFISIVDYMRGLMFNEGIGF